MFEVTDDPAQASSILDNEVLCFLLNPNLRVTQIAGAIHKYHIYAVEYEGEIYRAVACGIYKNKQSSLDEYDTSIKGVAKWLETGETPVLDCLVHDPLCVLLSEKIHPRNMAKVKRAYKVIYIEYNGKQRAAIACVYHIPNTTQLKGQVLSQEFIGVK